MQQGGGLAALAKRQQGLFTYHQAIAARVSAQALFRALQSGELERVHPTVYRFTSAPETQNQRDLAAVLWGGPYALLSHLSAARRWGWDFERRRTGSALFTPEIIVPLDVSTRVDGIVVHRSRWIPREHRTVKDGVPVTKPKRTLIDLAALLSAERLDVAVGEAFRRKHCTFAELHKELIGAPFAHRGVQALKAHLWRYSEKTGSPLEDRLLGAMLRYGLPMPKVQHPVQTNGRLYHVDLAYPRIRLAIEAQGEVHRDRHVFLRDQVRISKLNEAGWSVLLVTHHELESNGAELLSSLAARLSKAA